MKVLNIPNINFNTDGDISLATSKIKEFYKSLGWNESKEEVDPCKVKICEKDWLRLLNDFKSNGKDMEEVRRLGFMWMNYAPSVSEKVREGTIRIYEGFRTAI